MKRTLFVVIFLALTLVTRAQLCFNPRVDYTPGTGPNGLSTGDFNGDGNIDIVQVNYTSNNVSIFIGSSSGTVAAAVNYTVGLNPIDVCVGDFNSDSKLDLVVTNGGTSDISILIGSGLGTFAAAVNYTLGAQPMRICKGDFNGDGKMDIATANYVSNNLSVVLGTGAGAFGPSTIFSAGALPSGITTGDFDGDGKLDIATANFASNNVSILIGSGVGTFAAPTNYPAGTNPHQVCTADFNADGKLDLALTNNVSNNVSVLLGLGFGSFATAVNYAIGAGPYGICTGDFNGDGKLDLATANGSSNNVSILTGLGPGTFAPSINFAAGAQTYGVSKADFNMDGRDDLAIANLSSNTTSILLNGAKTVVTSGSICEGSTFTMSVTGAITYTFSGGSAIVTPTTTTTYTVIGTALSSCTSIAISTITVNARPTVSVTSGGFCPGSSFTMVPSGASTYTFSSGSPIVSPTVNTSYYVTGTSSFGCVSSNTAVSSVIVSTNPILSILKGPELSKTISIPNGETSLPYSPYIYSFADPLPPNTTLVGIDISLEGTDQGWRSALGDYGTAYLSITNELIGTSTFTNADWLALSIPEDFKPYNYTKNGFFEKYNYGGTNVFRFDFDSRAGWQGFVRNINVTFRYKEKQDSIIKTCENSTLTLNAYGAPIVNWSGGISNNTAFTIATSTVYTATGINIYGCKSTASQTVVADASIITVNSGSVCPGENFTIIPAGGISYTITSASNIVSNIVTPSVTTSYSVVGTNSLGCVSKIAICEVVVDCVLKTYSGITPNGDGLNDVWEIDNITKYPQNKVTIFNRWGNKLFDASGYDNKTIFWPQQGISLTSGTYFYVVDLGDQSKPLKGWIELIKN